MSPIPTARRNLAWRIEQLLREKEVMPTSTLTGWQSDRIMEAIDLLEEGRIADGEHVIIKATMASIFEPAG